MVEQGISPYYTEPQCEGPCFPMHSGRWSLRHRREGAPGAGQNHSDRPVGGDSVKEEEGQRQGCLEQPEEK